MYVGTGSEPFRLLKEILSASLAVSGFVIELSMLVDTARELVGTGPDLKSNLVCEVNRLEDGYRLKFNCVKLENCYRYNCEERIVSFYQNFYSSGAGMERN